MKIKVTPHTISIERDQEINAGEYKVSECEFEFSEEYEGLTNNAVFSTCENTYEVAIFHNKCQIPSEVLEEPGQVLLGVYGYELDGEDLKLRYSPTPKYFNVIKGSYKEGEEPTPPTPSVIDQLQAQINQNANDIDDINEEISDINTTIGAIEVDIEDLDEKKANINDLSQVAFTGEYNDLLNKPNLNVYSLITETGNKIDLEINSDYVLTAKLYDKNNNLISTSSSIDLPLESAIVNASYNSTTKTIIFTLQNGNTLEVPIGDLISGLQEEITPTNKLSSDLVDDTGHTNKFVTSEEKTTWNNKSDFSGSYNDLTNKPDLTIYEEKSNKVTTIDENSTDTQYPSAKCVYDSQQEQNEEIEKANMIYNALPRVTGTGTSINLDKTAKCPMELEPKANTLTQETTTQNDNLFDENYYNNNSLYSTNVYKYTLSRIKGNRNLVVQCSLKSGKTAQTGVYCCLSSEPNPNTTGAIKKWFIYNGETTSTGAFDTTGYTDLYFSFYPATTTLDQIFDNYNLWVSTTNIPYTPFVPDSPSPDYPSEVHTISGDNTLSVCGKNRFNLDLIKTESIVEKTSTGFKMTKSSGTRFSPYYGVNLPKGLYTIVGVPTTTLTDTSDVAMQVTYDDNTTSSLGINRSSSNFGDSNKAVKSIRFYFQSAVATDTSFQYDNMMIINRNADDTYETYKGNNYPINLPVQNLSNVNDFASTGITVSNGVATGTTVNFYNNFKHSLGGIPHTSFDKQITLSFDVKITGTESTNTGPKFTINYTDDTSDTLNIGNTSNKRRVSMTSNANKVVSDISMSYGNNPNNICEISNWQIEYGDKANSYTPYGTPPIEVCKIGNYEDKFFKAIEGNPLYDSLDNTTKGTLTSGMWYLQKNIGKGTITNVSSIGTSSYNINYAICGQPSRPLNSSVMYCEKYVYSTNAQRDNTIRIASGTLYVYDNRFTTTAIAEQNLIGLDYYYQRTSPTYTLLNDTLQTQLENISKALSYQNQTNITQTNNDLPFVINASAIYDLSDLVTRVAILEV